MSDKNDQNNKVRNRLRTFATNIQAAPNPNPNPNPNPTPTARRRLDFGQMTSEEQMESDMQWNKIIADDRNKQQAKLRMFKTATCKPTTDILPKDEFDPGNGPAARQPLGISSN